MASPQVNSRLETIRTRALSGLWLRDEDLAFILALRHGSDLARLFDTARLLRDRHFGREVFLYGFIYFSTFCRNDCRFCRYRRSNTSLARYRKSIRDIVAAARRLATAGVHLIDLTLGEDPDFLDPDQGDFSRVVAAIRAVKAATGLPVMISPGVPGAHQIRRLAEAGADWFACYQETYDRESFSRLRVGQGFDARMAAKTAARHHGMRIEEGLLAGVGESDAHVVRAVGEMRRLGADQVRVMNFVPQPGTPMRDRSRPDRQRELKIIALLRLAFPDRLIPASLDVEGVAGLRDRLLAGANVVTSLVPPGSGLSGVAQEKRDIEAAGRTPAGILPVLSACGLKPARLSAYRQWLARDRGGRRRLLPEVMSA